MFNACADISMNISTPTNGVGYQIAQDGVGYSGIVTYSYNASQIIYREYLETKLNESLQKDHLYHVSFYASLANVSPLATNRLGFGFVNDTTLQYLQYIIEPINFVSNPTIITDTVNWVKFEGYYSAKGDENYLIIGNFNDDSATDTITTGQPLTDVYYLIDNVSITEVSLAYENVFSPNNDGINDLAFFNPKISGYNIEIINRLCATDTHTYLLSSTRITPPAALIPRTSGRYMSSAKLGGMTNRPGVTTRTR